MSELLGALDQGTTSTRFVLMDKSGGIIAKAQREHRQIYPRPGWVEHDAAEIWRNAQAV
ncbi:MAG: glycerol kinase, partial [Methylocystis sp.]|nr:glycerol kinase [Methylocystis sp.]